MSKLEAAKRGDPRGRLRRLTAHLISIPTKHQGGGAGGRRSGRLLAALLVALLALMGGTTPLGAADKGSGAGGETLDFSRSVQLALQKSPYLLKSRLEIGVKRLDESDSRYGMVPPITLVTSYYVNQPRVAGATPQAYYLSFSTEGYNPVEAYLTLQARKLVTQIAILGHLKVIEGGIHRLAGWFIKLDALKREAAVQKEIVGVARQNLEYARKRFGLGQATTLDVQTAAKEVEVAQGEGERLTEEQNRVQEDMKAFVGLSSSQGVAFDLREVQSQVLDRFEPGTASLEQARASSYDLKIQALKKELQTRNITLAKARLLPVMVMGVQTSDPLSGLSAPGYYTSVGLSYPVWDGFQRVHNVTRQKLILKQVESDGDLANLDFNGKWQKATDQFKSTAQALKLAKAQEELAGLKERQGEISYHSGGAPLSEFLASRKERLEAGKSTIMKSRDYDQAALDLRYLSGDLGKHYVDMAAVQEE